MDVIQIGYKFVVDIFKLVFDFYTSLGAWGYVAVACFFTALERFVLAPMFGSASALESAAGNLGSLTPSGQRRGKYSARSRGKYER